MIQTAAGFAYPEVEKTIYKDEPGTWVAVSRRVLAGGSDTKFETRYFEIAPGGYTSREHHHHEHVVVVLRGEGAVILNEVRTSIGVGDVVHVAHDVPHQFFNPNQEPFGILCVVDRDRDRPVILPAPSPRV